MTYAISRQVNTLVVSSSDGESTYFSLFTTTVSSYNTVPFPDGRLNMILLSQGSTKMYMPIGEIATIGGVAAGVTLTAVAAQIATLCADIVSVNSTGGGGGGGSVAGAALDGTDATSITAPMGGVGIRGWLSGIYNRLNNNATTTLQTTGNTSLASLDTKQPALISGASPVVLQANSTGAGGSTPYKLIATGTTNAISVKGSAGNLLSVVAIGLTSTVRYLKLYNKATAPTVGTDTPVLIIPIPANTQGAGVVIPFQVGVNFSAGIALAITGAAADSDTTAVTAGDVIINLTYA